MMKKNLNKFNEKNEHNLFDLAQDLKENKLNLLTQIKIMKSGNKKDNYNFDIERLTIINQL